MKVYKAINEVALALARDGIGKARNNEQQGYKFRGIDDMYNALAVPMAKAGLCILPRVISRSVTERESKKGGALFYVVVDCEFDFVCAEDASKHTVKTFGEAMDSGDKATNKAMSAAYKYACMQSFCIPTEADNDADSHTHEVASGISAEREGALATSIRAQTTKENAKALWGQIVSECAAAGDVEAKNRLKAVLLAHGAALDAAVAE